MVMPQPTGRRAGFTIVEMIVSTGILGIMMGFMLSFHRTSDSVADQTRLQDEVENRLGRSLQRISDELRGVADASIWEDLEGLSGPSDVLTFQTVVSLEGGVATLGPIVRLDATEDPSDPIDDADNDGDGLVDERALYLTRDYSGPTEQRVLLSRNVTEYFTGETLDNNDENGNGLVDEPGFHIARDGDRLIVRLALQVVRSDGASQQREGEVSIEIRN